MGKRLLKDLEKNVENEMTRLTRTEALVEITHKIIDCLVDVLASNKEIME